VYELSIVPERGITFSREDASNLAQAKAANYCGQMIALRKFGINPRDINKLYLAGGFANYVNVRNAIEIGFLAPVPEGRIVKIGTLPFRVHGALSRRKRQAESLVKKSSTSSWKQPQTFSKCSWKVASSNSCRSLRPATPTPLRLVGFGHESSLLEYGGKLGHRPRLWPKARRRPEFVLSKGNRVWYGRGLPCRKGRPPLERGQM
jgi:hypothetical protein